MVNNVTGALGLVGLNHYVNLPDNGDYIFVGGTQVPYLDVVHGTKFMEQLTPIHGLVYTQQLILVPQNSPLKTIADFKGKELMGGSSHPSTQSSMELLDKKFGSSTTVVNYKQAAQLAVDTASGILSYTIGGKGNGATAGFLANGQLRVIATLDSLRIEDFSWNAFFVHSSLDPKLKQTLTSSLSKVMHSKGASTYHQPLFLADSEAVSRLMVKEYRIIKEQHGKTSIRKQ